MIDKKLAALQIKRRSEAFDAMCLAAVDLIKARKNARKALTNFDNIAGHHLLHSKDEECVRCDLDLLSKAVEK